MDRQQQQPLSQQLLDAIDVEVRDESFPRWCRIIEKEVPWFGFSWGD
jgi:hypothetical protein